MCSLRHHLSCQAGASGRLTRNGLSSSSTAAAAGLRARSPTESPWLWEPASMSPPNLASTDASRPCAFAKSAASLRGSSPSCSSIRPVRPGPRLTGADAGASAGATLGTLGALAAPAPLRVGAVGGVGIGVSTPGSAAAFDEAADSEAEGAAAVTPTGPFDGVPLSFFFFFEDLSSTSPVVATIAAATAAAAAAAAEDAADSPPPPPLPPASSALP